MNLHTEFSKSVNDAFCAGSIGSQCHADGAIAVITLRFSKSASTDAGAGSTKGGQTFLISWLTPKSSSCSYYFPFRPQMVNHASYFRLCSRFLSYPRKVLQSVITIGIRQLSVAPLLD